MRNILLTLLIALFSCSFMMVDAQAKRFGGGKSFGVKRDVSSFSRSNTASRMGQTAAKPASTASKWLAPLAGLAIGGMLASLFMGHGLGSGIMSWLLIAGGIFLVWRLIRSRIQPASQPAQSANVHNFQSQPAQNTSASANPFASIASKYSNAEERPTDFDDAAFLRNAKSLFIRLQAAYDAKNLADIREFTAPEIFAEIQMQIQERGNELNQTEVVTIDAELMDLAADATTASVQFSGHVREEQGATPTNINEIWHLQKNIYNQSWIVSGIQQA